MPVATGQGVAQVVAQLLSADRRLAAKASRALVLRSDQWSLRCGVTLSVGAMGLPPAKLQSMTAAPDSLPAPHPHTYTLVSRCRAAWLPCAGPWPWRRCGGWAL